MTLVQPNPLPAPAPQAIILAAGKGTRMGGDAAKPETILPKVVYEVAGRPMVHWVVRACLDAGVARCLVVIGFRGELVRAALDGQPDVAFVDQPEQLGTGHAARMAEPCFAGQPATDVFVLAGDGPLIRPQTLQHLLQVHRQRRAAATLATAVLDDPAAYGRVLRGLDGGFERIVEYKDATPAQRQVREINPSYYCFRSDDLFRALAQVRNTNRQKEYYLTDVPGVLRGEGRTVAVVDAVPPEDVLSINTPAELAAVDALLRARLGLAPAGAARGEAP